MFGGGEIKQTKLSVQKSFCGGAFNPKFDPAKDGDMACSTARAADVDAAFDGLNTAPEQDRAEGMLKRISGQVYVGCQSEAGWLKDGKVAKGVKKKFEHCMAGYASGAKKIVITGANTTAGLPLEFANFGNAAQWVNSVAKGGGSAEDFAFDRIPLPETLRTYLDTIRENYPILAESAERLFREAINEVPKGEQLKAAQDVATQVQEWAAGNEGALAAEDTKAATELEIIKTYVDKVGEKPDYEVTPAVAPDALFVSDNVDISAALSTDYEVVANFRRLFVEALKSFRAWGGKDENAEVIATSTAGAVKRVFEDSDQGISLSDYKAMSLLDNDNTLSQVLLLDGRVRGVPRRLIDGMGARASDHLAYALADLWNQVMKLAGAKGIDLNKKENETLRNQLVEDLLKDLKDVKYAEDAIIMYVTDVDTSEGTVTLKTAGGINTQGLAEVAKLAALRKARELYVVALNAGGAKYEGDEPERVQARAKLAKLIADASGRMILKQGLAAFEGAEFDGFNEEHITSSFIPAGALEPIKFYAINPLKYSPATAGGDKDTTGKIKVGGGFLASRFTSSASAEVTTKWKYSDDGKWQGVFRTGGKAGHNPSYIENPENEPFYERSGGGGGASISDLHTGVIYKRDDEWSGEGDLGWIGGPAAGMSSILGGKAMVEWRIDKAEDGRTLKFSFAIGAPHKISTSGETADVDLELFKNIALQPQVEYVPTPAGKVKVTLLTAYRETFADGPNRREIVFGITPEFKLPYEMELTVPVTANLVASNTDLWNIEGGVNFTGPDIVKLSGSKKTYTIKPDFSISASIPSAGSKIARSHDADPDWEGVTRAGRWDVPNATRWSVETLFGLCWTKGRHTVCGRAGGVRVEVQSISGNFLVEYVVKF